MSKNKVIRHGYGRLTSAGNFSYIGGFSDDQRNGPGLVEFTDIDGGNVTYFGDWSGQASQS